MFKWIKKKFTPRKSVGIFIEDDVKNITVTKINRSLLWNFDMSIAALLSTGLKAFAKDNNGYPPLYADNDKDNGYENWTNKILEIAGIFDDYLLDYCELEETEEGRKKIASFVLKYDELDIKDEVVMRFESEQKGLADDLKMSYIQNEQIKTAMNWLGENFGNLWW